MRDFLEGYFAFRTMVKELVIIGIALFILFQVATHQHHQAPPNPNPPRPAVIGPPAHHNPTP